MRIFLHKSCCGPIYLSLLVVSVEVESLSHGVGKCLLLWGTGKLFPKVTIPIDIHQLLNILTIQQICSVISLWPHLAFPDDWCWAPLPVLIAHLDSFCEVCIQVTDFYIVLLLKWLLQVVFLHMNPLSFTCIANVFSLVMACLFTLIVSSWWEGFNFGEIYQFLSFMVDIFCVLKYLPILRVMEILFSSRRFALPFTFGSLINFE